MGLSVAGCPQEGIDYLSFNILQGCQSTKREYVSNIKAVFNYISSDIIKGFHETPPTSAKFFKLIRVQFPQNPVLINKAGKKQISYIIDYRIFS
jgi:hypothetical protein